jgi:L-idonate 5-dehydrogenase
MTLQIVRLHGQNDLRLETLDEPEAAAGEVIVAIGAAGFCGSDLHYYSQGGIGTIRVREPIILGHEAAGTVVALGAGVEGLALGDVVAINPSHPCGHCRFCDLGQHQHCLNMRFKGSAMFLPHEQGFMRDRVAIGARQCHRIAPGVPVTEAALAEPLAVCCRAVARAIQVGGALAGKRVLVTGSGPIGVLCAALAHHHGAAEIVVTDLHDATLAVAKAVGATRTINILRRPEDLESYQRSAVACTRPLGTIVQVGVMGDTPLPFNMVVAKEINLIGTHRFDAEFGEAVALINQRVLNLADVVTHVLPSTQAQEAIAIASDRTQAVKVQLSFAQETRSSFG